MRRTGLLLIGLLTVATASVAEPIRPGPVISIIIDDIGDRLPHGRRSVSLPGPVACAFLPHAPHTERLAREAHAAGKEVMLHQPMQSTAGRALGPGAVTLDMDQQGFLATVEDNLRSVPHVIGVNNHMGSLLTRHPGHMSWLMRDLRARGLFFVDSRTSAQSVAAQMAGEAGVPHLSRQVFLDHDDSIEAVTAQYQRLLRIARRDGWAVAIGHPYESTLTVLEAQLPRLQQEGIALIPVAEMIRRQQEHKSWRVSSSR